MNKIYNHIASILVLLTNFINFCGGELSHHIINRSNFTLFISAKFSKDVKEIVLKVNEEISYPKQNTPMSFYYRPFIYGNTSLKYFDLAADQQAILEGNYPNISIRISTIDQ